MVNATEDNLAIPADISFLGGGGEMGERIRAFDWTRTSIGGPDAWSPALRTMLQIMLANRFPHILWWGPEYLQFYNDAYRPIPGTKHPHKVLGRPACECWAEIWHVIGPLIDRPFNGGPATWNDDILLEVHRHGFLEESHFTIAYSPVPDDMAPNGIGGVLATVHEITEKVIGERRVAALRDLGAKVGDARTAERACAIAAKTLEEHARDVPFALLYLIDRDGKHARLGGSAGVKAGEDFSPQLVELTGTASGGWPMLEAHRTETPQVVTRLRRHFEHIPRGPWSDPPDTAVVMTVPSSKPHHPAGFLIAGVSARLRLDRSYQDFFGLVRTQIATAIAHARAYHEERQRAEALAEIDRAKTTFFSNVSHEFRTPLTLMLAPLEDLLARSQGEISAAVRAQLELINRNGGRLLRLVNNLLDFSRIEAGRIRASYEPTDVGTFTADLASVFRAATERAGLRLVVDSPRLSRAVYVDPEMWEKIVLNLVSNAFKFTFAGGIEVSVREVPPQNGAAETVARHEDGRLNNGSALPFAGSGYIELRVKDTGVGIPAEEMPRVFERFHRIEATRSRTHEGSGIGLALVQELVKLHGGTVTAESEVNRGTAFIIRIPLGTAHLPAERLTAKPRADKHTLGAAPFVEEALRWLPESPPLQPVELLSSSITAAIAYPPPGLVKGTDRPSVLIADDNADMRLYVMRLLAARYEVNAVADGRAALAAARRCRPDVIVSDVMMPELDGFGLLREVRADSSLRDVPVILLSARAGEESRLEGFGGGADDYIVKPFSARELSARVDTHVQLARLRREVERTSRQRAEQFETLLNQAPLGVYLVDADFCIAQVNPTARAVFGDIPDLVGRDFDEVIHILWAKNYADETVGRFWHTLATGEPYRAPEQTEYRIDRRATEHYEWRIDRIRLPDGRFGVVCYFRDIAERKRHEANLAFLARLSAEFAPLATAESVMAVAADELYRELGARRVLFLEINEAADQITVLGRRSDDGRPELKSRHAVSEYLGDALVRELRAGNTVAINDVAVDRRTAARASAFKPWGTRSVLLAPVVTEGQWKFLASMSKGVGYDWHPDEIELLKEVSGRIHIRVERARAEEALAHARDQLRDHAARLEQTVARRTDDLRATVQELEAFSYSIAHDMRAPLRAMQGFAKILNEEHGAQLADQGKAFLKRLCASAARLDALIQDVLNYSKIARAEINLEAVDVEGLLREIVESYPNLQSPNANIQIEGPFAAVLANRAALTQVLSNLLGNAVKFVAPGVKPEVKVWSEPTLDGWVRIWIQDNGIGMRPDALDRIFLMFQRLNAPSEYDGTGIGLAIVKKALDRMGGKVGVKSELGQGSRFWILLKQTAA